MDIAIIRGETMDITIRKATLDDVNSIVDIRMEFVYELSGKRPSDEFKNSTRDYLYNHLSDGTALCFLAIHKECIVSSVILCINRVIPRMSNITGKIGYVYNVYTKSEFRKQGLATKLMNEMITEARKLGVGELFLSATDEGRKVYEKFEFQSLDREMCLQLI